MGMGLNNMRESAHTNGSLFVFLSYHNTVYHTPCHRCHAQLLFGMAEATIEAVVAEARSAMGKAATAASRTRDQSLAAYLREQEIETAADFIALSEAGFRAVAEWRDCTLAMADALRTLRRAAAAAACPSQQCARSPSHTAASGGGGGGGGAPAPKRARLLPPAATTAAVSPSAVAPMCRVVISDEVGTITMTHNRKRNALCAALCAEIRQGMARCTAAAVRVLVLRAEPGVGVWSAGHDMREFERTNGSGAQGGTGTFRDPLSRGDPFVQLLNCIRECPVPVIAAVEGGVWGGACDIVACCDVVIACPECTFAITPAKVGLPYHASGMSHFLGVLPLHVVKWMFFTALPLSAAEAARHGLVNNVVPAPELSARLAELAATVAGRAPLAVQVLKLQLKNLSQAAAVSPDAFEAMHEMRKEAWSSADMQEGVSAFFEKRQAKFLGR
jgi:methylmalonyl-CoA decarboxylase